MMDTSLKYHIIERIIQSKDNALLSGIKSFLDHYSEGTFETELPKEVKLALRQAEAELDQGKGISHEKIMKEMKDRF